MLLTNGIWLSTDSAFARHGGAALILDRDGVLIEDVHYISRAEDVRLERGAVDLIKWARAQGLAVVTITNQSGIARGFFDWDAFEAVERELAQRLASHGLSLDLTVACPFHPDYTSGYGREEAYWRKPGPGMIELAANKLEFELNASWMIGDRASDMAAARNAGLAGAIHVLSGHGADERSEVLDFAEEFCVIAARDLPEAQLRLSEIFSRR